MRAASRSSSSRSSSGAVGARRAGRRSGSRRHSCTCRRKAAPGRRVGYRRALAGRLPDDLRATRQLGAVQPQEVDAAVAHQYTDARIAIQIAPALAARQRVGPQGRPVPDEPERAVVRMSAGDGGGVPGRAGCAEGPPAPRRSWRSRFPCVDRACFLPLSCESLILLHDMLLLF